jgi:NDP-sugar pyrophosphorylase family protein
VLNEDMFVSVISIGDIQRAIIKNINLDTPIYKILRKEVFFAYENDNLALIKERMKTRKIELMPIVSTSNKLINIIFWEELFNEVFSINKITKCQYPVVIMAGGLGTRLKPLTNVLPKALIPIGEKTIIEDIISRFEKQGCSEFYISVNYKAEMIEYYLNNLTINSKISFFKEQKPLGTAGSLTFLIENISTSFFVTNCDILINQDYSEIINYHRNNKNEITIVAALKHYPIAYGIIETGEDGKLINLIEKPELTFKINSGMYILEPHLLKEIPVNTFFHITELIEKIRKRNGAIGVFPVNSGSWTDIGTWEDYLKLKH